MIPPDANAAFVATMEDVLEVYCHSACNIDPLGRGIGVQN